MRNKIAFILMCCALCTAQAQKRMWTLQECVAYAVEHNLTVQQFALDVANAQIDKSEAWGNRLPTLNATSSLSSNTGFSINPTNNLPVNSTAINANGNITSNLTLFNGLQNLRQVQRAKLNALANQYRLEDLKDDIRLNVANAYLQVVSNKEQLKALRAQYTATEQDVKRTQERVAAGVVPRGDLLEVEATAAAQQQQIINAEGAVLIAKVNLAQLLQITDYENFHLAEESFPILPSRILENSAKTIFDQALSFRSDIKFSEANVALAKKDVQIAKGAYTPTLSAFFQYGTRYSDATEITGIVGGDTIRLVPSFTDQLWLFDGISYGAQLNVPLFNGWRTRNAVKRSKINLERAQLQFKQDRLDLEADIQQAYVDVTTFWKAYEAAEKTLEARRLAYAYARERYEVGALSPFEVNQAQARLENAEADLIRTKYDYIFRLKIVEFYYGLPLTVN